MLSFKLFLSILLTFSTLLRPKFKLSQNFNEEISKTITINFYNSLFSFTNHIDNENFSILYLL